MRGRQVEPSHGPASAAEAAARHGRRRSCSTSCSGCARRPASSRRSRTTRSPPGSRGRQRRSSLVGADLAARLAGVRVARRGRVVLVGLDPNNSDVWDLAVALGADGVVFLPSRPVLAARSSRRCRGRPGLERRHRGCGRRTRRCRGQHPGRGTVASWRLATACRRCSLTPTRSAVASTCCSAARTKPGCAGPISRSPTAACRRESLRLALPRAGRLTMLSCGRGESLLLPVEPARAVLDAARRSHDLVVVDLPRSLDRVSRARVVRRHADPARRPRGGARDGRGRPGGHRCRAAGRRPARRRPRPLSGRADRRDWSPTSSGCRSRAGWTPSPTWPTPSNTADRRAPTAEVRWQRCAASSWRMSCRPGGGWRDV